MAHRIGGRLATLIQADCDAAARALGSDDEVHARVHRARKAIRRVRSMLALVRPLRCSIDAVDHLLQRVGDSLSRLRDAQAALETATRLAQQDQALLWQPVVTALQRRADRLAARALALDPGFLRRRAALDYAAVALQQLDWTAVRGKHVRHALKRQRRRVRKARRRACADGDADSLHRWRRRARRLRMQVKAAPKQARRAGIRAATGAQATALHALTDALGWRQDLHVLGELLPRLHGLPARMQVVDRLRQLQEQAGLP